MLKWAVQRGTSVVSKSVTPARIESNFKLFDWEISRDDMDLIATLNCGWRHLLWFEVSHHPNYPFKDELPWGHLVPKNTVMTPGQGGAPGAAQAKAVRPATLAGHGGTFVGSRGCASPA